MATVRQSYDMKVSTNGSGDTSALRDSGRPGDIGDYSIDVELSDHKKKMLEAFKVSSGYYSTSPKKNQSPTKKNQKSPVKQKNPPNQSQQVPRIYLFGHKQGDYLTKQAQKSKPNYELDSKTLPLNKDTIHFSHLLKSSKGKQNNIPQLNETRAGTLQTKLSYGQNKHKEFLKEILATLGLTNQNDDKLQFPDLMDSAYLRFIDMKSNGRWKLVQKYFKGGSDDDLSYSCVTNANRSIIKKKSMQESIAEKKKVKVVEPDTASQLIQTKFKLAKELETSLQKLTKGFLFHKYCYHTFKVEEVKVYLSYDLKCLAWQTKGKNSQVENMLNFNGITDGPRSKNYQKYISKNYPIDEQLAFSIIFKDRTLDLMGYTVERKQQFIECIKFTKSFI